MSRVSTFWTEELYNAFVKEAMLNPEEILIMKMLLQKYTIKEMAQAIQMSESTVSRRINMLRGKYDNLVKIYPERFPKRQAVQLKPEKR